MKMVLLFPGYGSQFLGMGKDLYDEYRIIQEYFEEAANCLNVNFVKLCFASSESELGKISNTYTATFLVSCSIAALLKELGARPVIAAGYNFGEFAAIHTAGGMSFPDGLYLLNKFISFYQEALESMDVLTVRVTNVSAKDLEALCTLINKAHSRVDVAIYTAAQDHVVSGTRVAVELLIQHLREYKNAIHEEIPLEVGLHSPLMESVAKQMRMYLEKVDFKNVSFPVVSSVDGRTMETSDDIKDHMVRHLESPIRWPLVVDTLADFDAYIEVGPGSTLVDMVKEKYPDKLVMSVNKIADLLTLKKLIEPLQEVKDETHADI